MFGPRDRLTRAVHWYLMGTVKRMFVSLIRMWTRTFRSMMGISSFSWALAYEKGQFIDFLVNIYLEMQEPSESP